MNMAKLINATNNTKRFNDWYKTQDAKNLIKAASNETGLTEDELLIVEKGGKPEIRGTYVHPILVPHISIWASPEFGIKVSAILNDVASKKNVQRT